MLIEDKGSGTQLIQTLRHQRSGVRVIPIQPEADKVTRMSSASALIEGGEVFLPEQAPWLDAFRREVLAFPNAKHDDQVDSLSQHLGYVEYHRYNRIRQGRVTGY